MIGRNPLGARLTLTHARIVATSMLWDWAERHRDQLPRRVWHWCRRANINARVALYDRVRVETNGRGGDA